MTQPAPSSHLPADATTRSHARAASWMVGGLFRYDEHLLTLVSFLGMHYPARAVARVAGVAPCAWSLETRGELRPPVDLFRYEVVLRSFAEARTGVVPVFDNPSVTADCLEDPYAHELVKRLLKVEFNPTQRNAVCVASDELAVALRTRYPRLPIICHPNRLIAGAEKRTPEFYEELEKKYNLIILHPRDAVDAALYGQLRHVGRYMAVANDPTLRNDPTRRDRLRLLTELHRSPWNGELRRALERMDRMTAPRPEELTCNLTQQEEAALYAAGIRSFVLQSSRFRHELTLWYDLFYHMFRTEPELSNKAALIASAALAHIRPAEDDVPSGLDLFSKQN